MQKVSQRSRAYLVNQRGLHGFLKDYYVSTDHPFDGKIYKMKNVFDDGNGPENKWVSFDYNNLLYSATYDKEEDAVPIKFYKVEGKPHVYRLKQLWKDNVYWISHSDNGTWIYGRYSRFKDAMLVYFEKRDHNTSFSSIGE